MKIDKKALSILHSQISPTARLMSLFAIRELEYVPNFGDYIGASIVTISSTDKTALSKVTKNKTKFMKSIKVLIENRFMVRVGPAKYLINDFYAMNHSYPGSIINDIFFVDSDDYEIRE